jgi:SAM-dependent methyltransferase
LHHFPENKLNDFLEEIKRILAPGGYFLLDDHDISDQTTKEMADLAHLVFNAVNGVSLQEEMQEVRNFQPMSHWINKLQEHGINCVVNSPDVHMIRPGDPTRNRMICSQKPDLRASRHGLFSQPTERNNQVEEGINLTPAFY